MIGPQTARNTSYHFNPHGGPLRQVLCSPPPHFIDGETEAKEICHRWINLGFDPKWCLAPKSVDHAHWESNMHRFYVILDQPQENLIHQKGQGARRAMS